MLMDTKFGRLSMIFLNTHCATCNRSGGLAQEATILYVQTSGTVISHKVKW